MSIQKIDFWLALSGVTIIFTIGSVYLYLLTQSPLSFDEMDFNNNGFVTFGELSYASSYETKQVDINNKQCTEYYALKDGLKLKVVCD